MIAWLAIRSTLGRLASSVPLWAWAIAAALAYGGYLHHKGKAEGAAAEAAKVQAAAEIAAENARILSHERVLASERVDREVIARQQADRAAAASRHADADGLRNALHRDEPPAGSATAECRPERARAVQLAGLLDTCSRLVEEGAGIVGDAVTLIDGQRARDRIP